MGAHRAMHLVSLLAWSVSAGGGCGTDPDAARHDTSRACREKDEARPTLPHAVPVEVERKRSALSALGPGVGLGPAPEAPGDQDPWAFEPIPDLEIAPAPDDLEIDNPGLAFGLLTGYDGVASRTATRIQFMLDAGFDGGNGNRLEPSQPVRVGVFEAGMPNHDHVGWRDCGSPFCASRVLAKKNCEVLPCLESTAGPATTGPHGTIVAYIAAGSIEANQDPSYPGWQTDAQRRRSGHLPEARLVFYTGGGSDAIANGIRQAAADGVDVLNLSLGWGPACDPNLDVSGINAALEAARKAGVVVVACAGNSGAETCSSWYPAVRTDTLAINGLASDEVLAPYDTLRMLPVASRGGLPVRVYNGWTGTTPVVDLAAPGRLHGFARHEGSTGYDVTGAAGCSVAAPVVTAAVGALRHAMHEMGQLVTAESLMANMLLMGDGWEPEHGEHLRVGLSPLSGAGRLRMHWYGDLAPPRSWTTHVVDVHEDETVALVTGDSGPESSAFTQCKWAGLWFEDDLSRVADLDFFLYDACPPEGGETLVAMDIGFGLRTRFDLRQPEIAERCLELRVVGTAVPPEGRRVWLASYCHGGDPAQH